MKPPIPIGKLKDLCDFHHKTPGKDAAKQRLITLAAKFASRRVCFEPTNSTEVLSGNNTRRQTTEKITMRFLEGLTLDDVIIFGERRFEITGIINLEERNQWLIVTALELVRPMPIVIDAMTVNYMGDYLS